MWYLYGPGGIYIEVLTSFHGFRHHGLNILEQKFDFYIREFCVLVRAHLTRKKRNRMEEGKRSNFSLDLSWVWGLK